MFQMELNKEQFFSIIYSVYVDNSIRILGDSKIGCMYNHAYGDFLLMQMISVYYVQSFLGYKNGYRFIKSMPVIVWRRVKTAPMWGNTTLKKVICDNFRDFKNM